MSEVVVSVVIPCFNGARTLRETIDSALAQSVPSEVIVIDDGSQDSSAQIIRGYGGRVRGVFGPNRGVSAARNAGTRLARGEFLQYVDHDDVLLPGALEARVAAAEAGTADVVYSDWQDIIETADGGPVPGDVHVLPEPDEVEDLEAACATSEFWGPPVVLLYRRRFVEERVGEWHTGLPVVQDARFLFEAAAAGGRFRRRPGVSARYRVSPDSNSRIDNPRFIRNCCVNTEEIEAVWRGRGPLPQTKVRALRRMWRHAAMASAATGLEEFETARAGHNRVAPRNLAIEAAALLRRGLGPGAAGAVARRALALRDIARGDTGPRAAARGR